MRAVGLFLELCRSRTRPPDATGHFFSLCVDARGLPPHQLMWWVVHVCCVSGLPLVVDFIS